MQLVGKNGQNSTKMFFLFMVGSGYKQSCVGYLNAFASFAWHNGTRSTMSFLLPTFVVGHSRVWHCLHCDPIHCHRHLSLFKCLVSRVCRVPFHFTAIQL